MIDALTDIVILLLLVGMLGYAWLLDRRIRRLMAVMRDIQPVVREFSDAVDTSRRTIHALTGERPATGEARRDEPPHAGSEKSDLVKQFFDTSRRNR